MYDTTGGRGLISGRWGKRAMAMEQTDVLSLRIDHGFASIVPFHYPALNEMLKKWTTLTYTVETTPLSIPTYLLVQPWANPEGFGPISPHTETRGTMLIGYSYRLMVRDGEAR